MNEVRGTAGFLEAQKFICLGMLTGNKLNKSTYLSCLNDFRSTYTVVGSGPEVPWRKINQWVVHLKLAEWHFHMLHFQVKTDNLVTYRKNPNSVLNAHPVFNQMGQGYSQHLREDSWPAFSLSFFPFLPQERRLGARAAPNGYQGEEGPHPWTQGQWMTDQYPWNFQNQHWPSLAVRHP